MNLIHTHRRLCRTTLMTGGLFALSLMTFGVQAQDAAVDFSYKDWDLVCDNTLTCRAAGYSADSAEPGVTVLLTRKAGVATPVDNQIMFAERPDDESAAATPSQRAPTLIIDDRNMGALQRADQSNDTWRMSTAQFSSFLSALRRDSNITFEQAQTTFLFSGAGSSAILLKMDDVQGRLETRSAIFKKGTKDDADVKPPIAAPVIVKAPVKDKEARDMNAQEIALFKAPLLSMLKGNEHFECEDEQIDDAGKPWQIARLDDTHSLVIAPCWMAAYNDGSMFWLVDNAMAQPAQPITDRASYYLDGGISLAMKGRGIGDCWGYESWDWDGKSFVHSGEGDTGRCRMIRAGGSWDMPRWVTTIVKP